MSPRSFAGPRPRRAAFALLACLLLAAAGCEILSVTGPGSGTVGQVLTYEVVVGHTVPATLADATAWLMVELPTAWSVAGASYSGSVDGNPVGGTPDQGPPSAADGGGCFGGDPAEGYQRVFFSAGPFPQIVQDDQGTLTVDLATAGASGDFTLRFRAATETGPPESRGLSCNTDREGPLTVSYEVTLVEPSVLEIPTLGTWGAALLALLLAAVAARRLAAG